MLRLSWTSLQGALAALVLLSGQLAGQQADSAPKPQPAESIAADTGVKAARQQTSAATAELAEQIRGQPRIRVRLVNYTDLELLEPRLVGASLRFTRFEPGGEPAAQAQDSMQVLPLAEVTRIQVRKSSVGKGAVIGLIAGGVTLAAVNLAGSPPTWDHKETPLFAIIGAGLGAVAGALIAAPFHNWTTIYEASPSGTR